MTESDFTSMVPGIASVMSDLIAGTLVTLAGKALASRQVNTDALAAEFSGMISYDSVIKRSVSESAKALVGLDAARGERLQLFLSSPEVEHHLKSVLLADEEQPVTNAEFKANLERGLKQVLPDSLPNVLSQFADSLSELVLQGCKRALDAAIQRNLLSAHDLKSALRHRALMLSVAEVAKSQKALLELMLTPRPLHLHEIREFGETYRNQVAARHQWITPPDLDSARKIPIDDLYVFPRIMRHGIQAGHPGATLDLEAFKRNIRRTVVLGNPGGGKSTLATKLVHLISTGTRHPTQRLFAASLVTLRDYATQKKERRISILDHIEQTSNTHYQIKPPPRAIEYLLLNGHLLVVFDGLDELLDTALRQEIAQDVESFSGRYPTAPILATSREVGYSQAPLDPAIFSAFQLAPFSDAQVRDYVTKWFSVHEATIRQDPKSQQTDTQAQRTRVEAFMRESGIVPDIRANPLMLALLCTIYRGESYIPRNRPDVYEKCSTMLFERWDKSRGIQPTLPFQAHIKPAIQHLAYWIYSSDQSVSSRPKKHPIPTGELLSSGVAERDLINKSAEYLLEIRFDDKEEARAAAAAFVAFCRGRAWVLTDTGTTAEGDRLYQFTHRTFLEFFAAAHLVRLHPTPRGLFKALRPHLAMEEWDVVAQLAFQICERNVEGGGIALLNDLLKACSAKNVGRQAKNNLLKFSIRCLGFLIPPPSLTKRIIAASLEACLPAMTTGYFEHEPNASGGTVARTSPFLLPTVMEAIVQVAAENRRQAIQALEGVLASWIRDGSKDGRSKLRANSLAFQIALSLKRPTFARSSSSDEALDSVRALGEEICLSHKAELESTAGLDLDTALLAHATGDIEISTLLRSWGAHALLSDAFWAFGIYTPSLVVQHALISNHEPGVTLRTLAAIGAHSFGPTPWITGWAAMQELPDWITPGARREKILQRASHIRDAESIFGLFVVVALLAESAVDAQDRLMQFFGDQGTPVTIGEEVVVLCAFRSLYRGRAGTVEKLRALGMNQERLQLIDAWAQEDLGLIVAG